MTIAKMRQELPPLKRGGIDERLPPTQYFQVRGGPALPGGLANPHPIRTPSDFSPAARMHRQAMTSGGLANFFFWLH